MPSEDSIETMRTDMNRLRGKLFQAVESWGRPDVQERAMKGVIRQVTYEAQANLEALLRAPGGTQ